MAEIENKKSNNTKKGKIFVKKNTRVDLTPMVDLGFLLITFFVFTTTLSTPTVMNLNMPYDKVKPGDDICASCVLTVLLEKNNKIKYYEGKRDSHPPINETYFGKEGIRSVILKKKQMVKLLKGSGDDFVLIIKPTDESTFENFINIVDEVAINNIKHYYATEMEKADQQ